MTHLWGRNHTYDVCPESYGKGLLLTEIEVHSRSPVITTATVTSSNLQNIVSHIMVEQALLMMNSLVRILQFSDVHQICPVYSTPVFSTLLVLLLFVVSVTKLWFTKAFFEVFEVYPVKCLPAV